MKIDNRYYLLLALVLATSSIALAIRMSAPPQVVAASAAPRIFSGERAMRNLEAFLAEKVPHPIGSPENQRVKRRIQTWLDARGIANVEQKAWGCTTDFQNSCALVENIIATLPGREAGPYVALMAHYDSVPAGPGAGDDMAGVVAVLETARAIRAGGLTKKPVLLLLTDGEETGLHGATAFFEHHPLAAEVGVLLNVEGAGTRGASAILGTSSANQAFMQTFARAATHPRGSSLSAEVFKRMPNDTDFSVAQAAGVAGIDFAFAGEWSHYHTPLDRPDSLDVRSLQHHGENLYPLTLALANQSVEAADGDVVFSDVYGQWVQWPASFSWPLYALAVFMLFLSSRSLPERTSTLIFASTLTPAFAAAAFLGVAYGMSAALASLNGISLAWPAHPWAFRLTYVSAMLLACCMFSLVFARKRSTPLLLNGVWWFVALIVGVAMWMAPPAASMLVILLPAAFLLCLAGLVPMPELLRRIVFAGTLVPAAGLVGYALQLEEALGYQRILLAAGVLSAYLLLLLPFLRGASVVLLGLGSAMGLAVGVIAASNLPFYSQQRPQHVNVRYYEDADAKQAYWRMITEGSVPAPMQAVVSVSGPALKVFPFYDEWLKSTASAQYRGLPPPQATVLADSRAGAGRGVTLQIDPQRESWAVALILPREAELLRMRIGQSDIAAQPQASDGAYHPIYFYGPRNQPFTVRLAFGTDSPIDAYLMEYSTKLPTQGLTNARRRNVTPVHDGDLSMVWQKVRI